MTNTIKSILEAEANAIKNIPVTNEYEKAINIIYEHVHVNNGKVVTSGMGKAGQIALNISTTLSSTGTPAVFLHPSEAQHGDLGLIQKNDILLLITNSGKTREIIELITLVARLYPEMPFILITSNKNCDLAQKAEAVLYTGNPKEVCLLGLSPTTSTTTMTVIGDILVVLMMKKINFSAKDYALRHHGGYLGEQSRNIANSKK